MRVRSASQLSIRAMLAALTAGLVASCSQGSPAASPAGPARSASATASPAASAAQAGCDSDPWRAAPVTVSHKVSVPPVPVVTAIRAAAHSECGYDRLVLNVSGKMPSYTIRYVDQVVADASGRVLSLPGSRFLLITMRPTQAHKDGGAPEASAGIVASRFPMLLGYAVAGDSEGVVTVAVGLRGMTGIRVGELPGRLYVDFRN